MQLTAKSLAAFRRQIGLLAVVLVLCTALPLAAGPAAQAVLADGVSFSGITLAVTAPEGDPMPELLEKYLGNMHDISRYCTMKAMDRQTAEQALESGEVSAILVLPEGFVEGILNGTNPDAEVIVSGEHPLEALLTLWVGQSAADLLSCVQACIYEVLDAWENDPPDGLSWDQAKTEINLRYITWTLKRQQMFEEREVLATGLLPVALHYGLALLGYLGLSLAPLFCCLCTAERRRFQNRLRSLGRGSLWSYGSDLAAGWLILFAVLAPPVLILLDGNLWGLAAAAVLALFCAVFGNFCALFTGSAANCGLLSFGIALLSLVLAGGVVPAVLLPRLLRQWSWLSPVAWLQALAAAPLGLVPEKRMLLTMGIACCLMMGCSAVRYNRQITGQEAA